MNFYPFHIGDYISHTSHLSNEEDLAYRRMIDLYYLSEQPLNDCSTIARKIRSRIEIVDTILDEFFELSEDGCWHNKRIDEEIAKYHDRLSQASRAGKASAEKRFNKRSTTVQLTKNHEPLTNNHSIGVAKATKGSRFAKKDQIPPSWESYCKEKRPDLKPADVYESFADYWISVPGAKGVKLDWDATWRTWIRNQRQNFQGTQDKPTVAWHQTLGGVMAKGKELGIEPRLGETEGQYRQRLIQGGA